MEQEKKKILFLINDLGIGGVQRLVVDFANRLDRRRFLVTVATLRTYHDSFFFRDELVRDVRFMSFSFRNAWDIKEWSMLYRFMRKNRFDIIFTQLFFADTVGRITAFCARTPLIVTEIQNLIPGLPFTQRFLDRLLAKVTDLCISTAAAVTAYAVREVRFPLNKIAEIPTNAVDEVRFKKRVDRESVREAIGIPKDARLIVNAGRLVGQKGQNILVRATPLLIAHEPKSYVAIIGAGALEADLKAESVRLGIEERVRFLGARKDIPEILMSADVFAFPSLWEGQGLILFDAIFARTPIVASSVGGIPEVVENNVTGLLVPPKDEHALAAAILRILRDAKFARTLAENAYERFHDRTLGRTLKRLEEVLLERLSAKKK